MAEVAQRIADGTDKLSKSAERSAEAITKAERAVRTAEDSIAFSNGQKIALLKTPNELHSTYVSDVEIFEADKFALNTTNEVGKVGTVGYDNILSNYLTNLQDISKNSSKVIDENGEPLLGFPMVRKSPY